MIYLMFRVIFGFQLRDPKLFPNAFVTLERIQVPVQDLEQCKEQIQSTMHEDNKLTG